MSTLGERLRAAREKAGLTQRQVAQLVGAKSQSVVSNWERDYAEPSANMLVELVKALNVDLAYVLDYYGGPKNNLTTEDEALVRLNHELDAAGRDWVLAVAEHELMRVKTRPAKKQNHVLTRPISFYQMPVSAGTGIDLGEEEQNTIDVPLDDTSKRADYVLKVQGDSMEPAYSDGDLILIQSANTLDEGQLGVFGLNGDGYFKKLGHNRLISLNGAYEPIQFDETDDVRCFGKVLGRTEQV